MSERSFGVKSAEHIQWSILSGILDSKDGKKIKKYNWKSKVGPVVKDSLAVPNWFEFLVISENFGFGLEQWHCNI